MLINIELQQLRCNRQIDVYGGAQPYLWTALLQIDDDTLAPNGPLVATVSHPPPPEGARLLLQKNMKAGNSAPIPNELKRLRTRFREGLMRRDLILVALLWDQIDTPGAAVEAGYGKFLSELRDAIADNLLALLAAMKAPEPDQDSMIQGIEQGIKTRVSDKVGAAIKDKLSGWEKLQIWLGNMATDRQIGSAFKFFAQQNESRPFTLTFHDFGDDFELDAQLFVDPCEELLQVESLQEQIATIEGALRQLGHAHGGEPRPEDEQKTEQLSQDLRAKRVELKSAQDAYERCHQRYKETQREQGGI